MNTENECNDVDTVNTSHFLFSDFSSQAVRPLDLCYGHMFSHLSNLLPDM